MARSRLQFGCWLAAFALATGCGGSTTPVEAPPPAAELSPAPEPLPAVPAEPLAPESAPGDAAADSEPELPPEPAEDPNAARDLRFVQSPDGLRVEILGVKFVPRAETIKTPAGFGVRVTVEASSSEPRTLLAPEHGPMAFAGVVKRKGKEPQPFGDDRKGDGELVISPDKPLKFSREWPGKHKTGLSNNDVVELDIALWGLGKTRDDGRPVKQFLRVEARVEAWRGHARIKPPPSVTGK